MNKSGDIYNYLISKLDEFIRKYYLNKLLRGFLYTIGFIIIYYLFIILSENQFYFSTGIRKLLFYSFVLLSLVSFGFFIVYPLLKLNKLGTIISHNQAAEIIGKHFSNVQDKLINILQLKSTNISLDNAALIEASINQKAMELKPIPFTNAIDLNENKKYLKYVVPPLLLFFALVAFKPSLVKNSTNRLLQNNVEFEKPAPFTFILKNENLQAVQFEDYKLNISLVGNELPNDVFLVKNDVKNSTQKLNAENFSYIFTNIQKSETFHLEASGFKSKDFIIEVLTKPLITNFQIKVSYPGYLDLKDETLVNTGDVTVPEGSRLKWIFDAQAVDKISMQFSDALLEQNNAGNNTFIFDKVLKFNDKYVVKTFNNILHSVDSSAFNISVVSDAYPEIEVEEFIDSTNTDVHFYIGNIVDDYGLKSLYLNYSIQKEDGGKVDRKLAIPFKQGLAADFTHYWNFKELGLQPGDIISYYFIVFDNDGVNGSKSTRSKWLTFKLPSVDELEDNSEKELEDIKKELKKNIEESADLQNELKELQEEVLQKKELSWEDKKQIEEILNRQKNLEKSLESLENKFDKNMAEQSEFKNVNPEIKKKQEQVQKLFDSVMDEEMKALIDKLEKLMEEMNKDKALEQMKDLEVNDEVLEDELDRMLELLKKLEQEQKIQETADKLQDLSKKQEELSKESEKKDSNKDDLSKKQNDLNKEFDDLKKDLEELAKESDNEKLDDASEDAKDIDEQMNKASDELNNGNKQKASEEQKDLSKKMSDLSKSLSDMMNQMQMASMEQNMETTRQLLENLVILSEEEESLFESFKRTTINTPAYISLIQNQFKLIDDSKLVEDSLFALAKRMFELEAFITDEIKDVNRNLDKAVSELEDRQVSKAVVNQQYVMAGYNNLALMLSEAMNQMQQQMAQKMPGNQMCQNPGQKPGSKPGKIPSLKQMQQQLSDQINQMSEMMKDGKGGKNPMNSQKLAEMAAKQQAIRQALDKINQEDNKDGKGSLGNLQKIMDEMEKNETDLVNKQLTNELLKRQQDIMVKLLEAENAERERDQKEERESNTARQYENIVPPSLEEYLKKQKGSLDFYKNIPPKLKPYYRLISEKYIQNINSN